MTLDEWKEEMEAKLNQLQEAIHNYNNTYGFTQKTNQDTNQSRSTERAVQ